MHRVLEWKKKNKRTHRKLEEGVRSKSDVAQPFDQDGLGTQLRRRTATGFDPNHLQITSKHFQINPLMILETMEAFNNSVEAFGTVMRG